MKTAILSFAALALVLVSGSAMAEGAKAKKPTTCQNFSEAKGPDGSMIGLCASKPGKKPRILSSYTITQIKGQDGAPIKVMIGF